MKKILLVLLGIQCLAAYSQNGDTIYVNVNATGNNDGTTWTDAYVDLMSAMSNGTASDQIWVAAGTYKPSASGDRNLSFNLISQMYGGFNGTETDLPQRNWFDNPVILSGDIGVVGDNSDNSYSVVKPEVGDSIVIDGFTIKDGYADGGNGATRYGAGIYIDNQNTPITIKNCVISDNMANSDVGIYCLFASNGEKNVTIENTRFVNNFGRWAPAFTVSATAGTMNANLINCLIENNETGVFPIGSSNAANLFPGGRFSQSGTGTLNGKVINCTFTKNVDNSTEIEASKSVFGVQGASNITEIYNTIFWDNNVNTLNSSIGFGSNSAYTPNAVSVYNTISEDVMDGLSYVTSVNNTQVDPLFVNTSNNDFSLQSSSPAINGGTTSGIASLVPTTDLAGEVREDGVIDLGCYEFQASVGIINSKQLDLIVYPNPTSNMLNFNEVIEQVQVYDLSGKLVLSKIGNISQIDLTEVEKGAYIIHLKNENGVAIQKIVKE